MSACHTRKLPLIAYVLLPAIMAVLFWTSFPTGLHSQESGTFTPLDFGISIGKMLVHNDTLYVLTSNGIYMKKYPDGELTHLDDSHGSVDISLGNDGTLYGINTTGIVTNYTTSPPRAITPRFDTDMSYEKTLFTTQSDSVMWGCFFAAPWSDNYLYYWENGYTFKWSESYSDLNQNLREGYITAMETDHNGTVWIGTETGGIYRIPEGETTAEYLPIDPRIDSRENCIIDIAYDEWSEYQVYVATETAVFVLDEHDTWMPLEFPGYSGVPNEIITYGITCLDVWSDHYVIGTNGGGALLFTIQSDEIITVTTEEGLGSNRISDVANNATVYIACSDGSFAYPPYDFAFDGDEEVFWRNVPIKQGIPLFPTLLVADEEYERIIGGGKGVTIRENDTWLNFGYEYFDSVVKVNDIARDSDGGVWFACDDGIRYLENNKWDYWSDRTTGIPSTTRYGFNDFSSIAPHSDGTVWCVTSHQTPEIYMYDGLVWTQVPSYEFPAEPVDRFVRDETGRALCVIGTSVYRRSGNAWGEVVTFDISGGVLQDITCDDDGNIYTSTLHDGILVYNGAAVNSITTDDGLPTDNAGTMYIDNNQRILWVQAGTELTAYSIDNDTVLSSTPLPSSETISSMVTLSDGALLVSTGDALSGGIVYIFADPTVVESPYPTPSSFAEITSVAPNPFNAATTITFDLRNSSDVTLAVYTITGQKVAVLADGYLQAGKHRYIWRPGDVASGVYFAVLEVAGKGVWETMKVMYVK